MPELIIEQVVICISYMSMAYAGAREAVEEMIIRLFTMHIEAFPVYIIVGLPLWCHLECLYEDNTNNHEADEGWNDDPTQCCIRVHNKAAGREEDYWWDIPFFTHIEA